MIAEKMFCARMVSPFLERNFSLLIHRMKALFPLTRNGFRGKFQVSRREDQAMSPAQSGQYEDLRRRITSAVRRSCPSWLGSQAEDIVQNVLVRLVQAEKKSEGDSGYSAMYLEKAAHGATVDEIRRRCRRKEQAIEDPRIMEVARDPGADPERHTAGVDIGQAIRECMTRLVKPRRLAVTLYLQGCTVPETGRRRGWTTKRAENLVYRGLADLRQCLERRGLNP
jgi:RNA polymerase sigma-70 factor (ECF subfamily)